MTSFAVNDRFDDLYWDFLQAKQIAKRALSWKAEVIMQVALEWLVQYLEIAEDLDDQFDDLYWNYTQTT